MSLQSNILDILNASKEYTDKQIDEVNSSVITQEDVDNAIAADNLSEQKWKPAVATVSALPSITGDEQEVTWLCKVIEENTVYQRIAGTSSSWTLYYNDTDFVDTTELSSAISTHDSSSSAHSDIRSAISTVATNAANDLTNVISTHDAALDSHSDIRTAIAAKGDVFESTLATDINNAIAEFETENDL